MDSNSDVITIRIFGKLRQYMDEMGLPYTLTRNISHEGESSFDIALQIGLSPEKIEAIFRNGKVINIYDPLYPGDRVAFFPFGTPGPYRVYLGLAKENQRRRDLEKGKKQAPK